MLQLLQQLINGLATGAGLVLASLGLNLIFGVVRVVNFAHGSFYILGGYIAYTAMELLGLNYWLALIVSVVFVAAFSAALDPLLFRLLRGKGETPTIIVTFGLALVLQEVTRMIWGPSPRSLTAPFAGEALRVGELYVNLHMVVAFVGAGLLVATLIWVMRKTWFGIQARSLAHDPFAAQLMGVRIHRVSAITWAVSGGLTAAAGVLVLPMYTLQPSGGLSIALMAFAIVIVGGMGSIRGTIIAGLAIGVVNSLVEGYIMTGVNEAIAFGALILVLLFRPQGLFGAKQ